MSEDSEKPFYSLTVEQIFQKFETSLETGLTQDEHGKRLEKYGENKLVQFGKESAFTLLINQFKDFLILILIGAVIISAISGEVVDMIAILAILLMNGFLGFYQEYKAEKSIEELQKLTSPHSRVLRNGKKLLIDSTDIVPGDLILIEAGDIIPADSRLVETFNFQIDESTLTGESLPVSKKATFLDKTVTSTSDQINMVFMGTNAVRGTAKAVCVETGMNTVIGNITELLISAEERDTPLKIKLNEFGRKLGWFILAICGLVVVIGTLTQFEPSADLLEKFLDMTIVGVALAVAAIPEGLVAVITLALSIGVIRMSRQKAIVRQLKAVETLGSTTVICSDKTGTLTQNKMTSQRIFIPSFENEISIISTDNKNILSSNNQEITKDQDETLKLLLYSTILCNNAYIKEIGTDSEILFDGDPTETALLALGLGSGLDNQLVEKEWKRIGELPFDSERKMMSTLHQFTEENGEYKYMALIKGAPDFIRSRCNKISSNGSSQTLNEDHAKKIEIFEQNFSESALRILGFAYKKVTKDVIDNVLNSDSPDYDLIESDMIYLGMVGMKDPPRPEAISAIQTCFDAGIRIKMVTGDHKNTALAIGREMGLINSDSDKSVITGQELEIFSDEELFEILPSVKIFARVNPEHKLRIVNILQSRGEIVAMTGDGVNDAPALKQADIGVAMGLGGTDVAKQASDMVLTDDNFATLETAIEEGRSIYSNMRKFIGYLLACNAGEVFTVFIGIIILGFFLVGTSVPIEEILPLTAIQLLYVNLVTDGLPALALGVDPKDPKAMSYRPRDPNESIFNKHLISSIILAGVVVGTGTLIIFFYTLNLNLSPDLWLGEGNQVGTILKAQTMAFTVLIIFQQVMALSSRSETESLFTVGVFANKFLILSILSAFLIHLCVIYLPIFQGKNGIFGTVPLEIADWIIIFAMSTTVLMSEEIRKFLFRKQEESMSIPVFIN
ncbi:MAG: cation-translocating P-type ATPase [Candidatus Hodarchaeales archaeon]|jgi:Ca2+-transporting ATPase